MSAIRESSVLEALKVVTDPDLGRDIVSLGFITEVGSRLHVTTPESRTGQISLGDGGGHRLASWTRGYATARSEAICRGAGCGRTRTSGSVGGQGQQRPWSTRPLLVGGRQGFIEPDTSARPAPSPNSMVMALAKLRCPVKPAYKLDPE